MTDQVTASQTPEDVVVHFGNGCVGQLGTYRSHAEHKVRPARVEMLAEAMDLTWGARDKEYGPPAINLRAAGDLKATMRKHIVRDIGPAELEALDMVLTKLARIITGTPKRDSYVDLAAFAAIAGEVAERDGSV